MSLDELTDEASSSSMEEASDASGSSADSAADAKDVDEDEARLARTTAVRTHLANMRPILTCGQRSNVPFTARSARSLRYTLFHNAPPFSLCVSLCVSPWLPFLSVSLSVSFKG